MSQPEPSGTGSRGDAGGEGVESAGEDDADGSLDLAAIEAGLRERLAELRSREADLKRPPEAGSNIGFGKRIGEGTTEAIGRLSEVGVADSLDAIEGRILRALEKLAEGSYGVCDVCGEPIPPQRLSFAPESNLCMRDAAAAARP